MSTIIFASYSRKDKEIVFSIVQLLRTALTGVPQLGGYNGDLVFLDIDGVSPGENWRNKIEQTILAADKVFVFWCDHSKDSKYVKQEYEIALKNNKLVIPVLVDGTALPKRLKYINAVDLRPLKLHGQHFIAAAPAFEISENLSKLSNELDPVKSYLSQNSSLWIILNLDEALKSYILKEFVHVLGLDFNMKYHNLT